MKTLLMGHKQVSADLLRFLTKQDYIEVVGVLTDSHPQGSPTAAVAQELDLPLYTFDTALEAVCGDHPKYSLDLLVFYWRKLRDEFLDIPTLGMIDFHPTLLPEYKDTGGYNLAIMDELDQQGSTAHHVDASIDTDEITEVDRFPIDTETETAQSLECKTMQAPELFARRVITRTIESKTRLPTTPSVGGRYISRDEMEAMKRIFDSDDIEKKIHAFWFPPYGGVYVETNDQKYTLVSRQLLEEVAPKNSTNLSAGKTNV